MRILQLALSLLLLVGAVWTSVLLDRRAEARNDPMVVYPPPAWLARTASLGHENLVADFYWLKALQYYAEEANRRVHFRNLHQYMDLVVDLDPDFVFAYKFGGTTIPYHSGGWVWHNVDESTALLKRGAARFPDDWRLWLQLGFNYGIIGSDYARAAEAYQRAAEAPGSPSWLPRLVTRTLATVGRLDSARVYAEEVLAQTEDPQLREAMAHRLLEIAAEERLRILDEAVARYETQFGEPPERLEFLIQADILREIPEDPLGGEFRIEGGRPYATSLRKGRLEVFE